LALRYIGVSLYSVSDARIASVIYLNPVAQIFCVFQAFLDLKKVYICVELGDILKIF